MRKIEFRAGYYEWNASADGECFYSFSGIEEDIEDDTTYEDLEATVDFYIDAMQDELSERAGNDEEEIELTIEELTELRKQMIEAWAQHFDIKEMFLYDVTISITNGDEIENFEIAVEAESFDSAVRNLRFDLGKIGIDV